MLASFDSAIGKQLEKHVRLQIGVAQLVTKLCVVVKDEFKFFLRSFNRIKLLFKLHETQLTK